MKKLLLYLLCAVVQFSFSSCTHNNGDIGPLFGRWTVTECVVDGQRQDVDCVIDFQSHIVRVTRLGEHGDTDYSLGTWTLDEPQRQLTLDFTHDDDAHSGQYTLPTYLGLTTPVTTFTITTFTAHSLNLSSPSTEWRLRKQY